MKTEYSCEQCKEQLFDFVNSVLPPLEKQLVDQHLQHCAECNTDMADIWNLQSQASSWRDERVPRWKRRQFFFDPSPWPMRMQWAASFASLLVLILVLMEGRISTVGGLSIDFATNGSRYVSRPELMQQLARSQDLQRSEFDSSVQKLTSAQIATNQLLLRTVLNVSRQERREDLGNMLILWEQAQDQRSTSTEESLQYLIASQIRDRREIEVLNDAMLQVSTDRNF